MDMLKIETGDKNEILRTVSRKIKDSEIKKYSKLWKEMIKYIKNPDNGWVWLAAPQIGHNVRLIVVWLPHDRDYENYKIIMMINPEIIEFSDEKETDQEWCLSVPGKKWEVERALDIKLTYLDEKGHFKTLMLEHLRARIVQHEIDHLNGILFTDKLAQNNKKFL